MHWINYIDIKTTGENGKVDVNIITIFEQLLIIVWMFFTAKKRQWNLKKKGFCLFLIFHYQKKISPLFSVLKVLYSAHSI